MKKIFSILLAVAMLATVSVTAFAAESATNDGTSNTSINVKGTYVAAQGAGEKISVDVAWDAMEFTYTEGQAGEWLPGEHKYADTTTGSWSTDTATITVTNHSNVAVTATLSFATAVDGVIGTFDKNTLDLASAAEGESLGDTDKAPQASAEFGISGAAITETKDTLGTITVAIAGPTVVTTEQELRDAVARGGKIMLGDDIDISSETFGLDINTDLTINLNGKTITGNMGVFKVPSGGTLTILGDGALKRVSPVDYSICADGGTVNLAGGEIEGGVSVINNGRLNITDGQIVDLTVDDGTCIVGGGHISYMHVNGGTCTVSDGQIDELNVNNGTCTVSGGLIGNLYADNCIVTGGTFDQNPSAYVDTTKYTVTNSGGKWTVTLSDEDEDEVPTITSEQELLEAIATGGEIILGGDIRISSKQYGLDINTNLTINLNGKTITGHKQVFLVNSGGTLTILGDGKLELLDPGWVDSISATGGTVNLAGGTIGTVGVEDNGNLNITDGTIRNNLTVNGGTCIIDGGEIVYMYVNGGTCTVSDGHIDGMFVGSEGTCTVTGGTFLNKDPSDYVDTTKYDVTYSDGKWTVTEK